MPHLPVTLIILDGYGIAGPTAGNAIEIASTPSLDALYADYPWAPLDAAGLAVGLPEGQMGNSEVGHLNIGAGRTVYQELTRISKAVADRTLFGNEVLASAIDGAAASGRAVHFMGLVSDGGVHSHLSHLFALLEMAKARGAERVYVHAFLDGRDVPPKSGHGYVRELMGFMEAHEVGRVASVMGRYYAMDRDNRWERVEKAWRAMVLGEGVEDDAPDDAIEASYAQGITDEFVLPVVVSDSFEPPVAVADGDAVVFFNFRPDRARELTRAFVDPAFSGFDRPVVPDVRFVCLTEYDPTIPAEVAFGKDLPCCVLADVIAEQGLKQLHIAETEKYAHVTFFLNGGVETPKQGEERVLIPSPKVATYDLKPEMSAIEVTDALVEALGTGRSDFYMVNYANLDMVGHTGVLEAAVRAMEAVDTCVGRVVAATLAAGGRAIVTADHGNAECMTDPAGDPFTAHTTDEVPFIAVADGLVAVRRGGTLADVAPSLLDMAGIEQPTEWTGRSLLVWSDGAACGTGAGSETSVPVAE